MTAAIFSCFTRAVSNSIQPAIVVFYVNFGMHEMHTCILTAYEQVCMRPELVTCALHTYTCLDLHRSILLILGNSLSKGKSRGIVFGDCDCIHRSLLFLALHFNQIQQLGAR